MSCRFDKHLVRFLDGELPGAERLAVEEHLASCLSCQARLSELRAVDGTFLATPAPIPPVGLADRILQAAAPHLAAARTSPSSGPRPGIADLAAGWAPAWMSGWAFRVAMGGATAALLVLGTVAGWNFGRETQRDSVAAGRTAATATPGWVVASDAFELVADGSPEAWLLAELDSNGEGVE
jgi:anti-sigma factor RsiW